MNNKKISFSGLTPRECTLLSKSVWTSKDVSSPREWYHLEHGATFSSSLAERVIKIFTAENDLVFDPFSGVGTTILAARNLNRDGVGIELYEKFVNITKDLLQQQSLFEATNAKIIHGDCRKLKSWIQADSVQLTFTSPPYANFIQKSIEDRKKTHKASRLVLNNKSVVKQYGIDKRDFGNLSYENFLKDVLNLMQSIYHITKPNGYNIWVVKDHRDTKHGKPLIPVHSDIAQIGEKVGFKFHDLIIWDQNDQRSLVLLGYPSTFYSNINHTFLVVLRKPNGDNGNK